MTSTRPKQVKDILSMTTDLNNVYKLKSLRAALAVHRHLEHQDNVFCDKDNLEESLSTLSEELDSLDTTSIVVDSNQLLSIESLKELLVKLINASWQLIHKYRTLMKSHDQQSDAYNKVLNDNSSLKNHVKRLKEDLQKKQHLLSQTQERERRLKVQCDSVSRSLKHEKDEILKLKKQAQSKDNQHEHELRRIVQNGHKLREQLQKSRGTYAPRDKVLQNLQSEHEKEILLYKQTIRRLEENSRHMHNEINTLKESLALHVAGMELQCEASGIWHDIET